MRNILIFDLYRLDPYWFLVDLLDAMDAGGARETSGSSIFFGHHWSKFFDKCRIPPGTNSACHTLGLCFVPTNNV